MPVYAAEGAPLHSAGGVWSTITPGADTMKPSRRSLSSALSSLARVAVGGD